MGHTDGSKLFFPNITGVMLDSVLVPISRKYDSRFQVQWCTVLLELESWLRVHLGWMPLQVVRIS